ncbi:hypothetical protein LTR17_006462 [Elasticomyces elasticus]|nr:hypothetical protein LTR17_006462 [Elasticomyces elasticus]
MSDEKEIYIVSVSYGHVLSWQPKGSPSYAVVQAKDGDNKAQRWVVEPGNESNTAAFRNAANGQYLNCQEAKNFGRIGLGARQVWRIDSPDFLYPPGAVRLQPVEFDKHFMNHDGPHRVNKGDNGAKAHMWQWEQRWDFNTAWYLQTGGEFNALAAATGGLADKASEETATKLKDIEAREEALGKKENEATAKLKDAEAREEAFNNREKEIASKQKDVEAREQAFSKKEEEFAEKQKTLDSQTSEAQATAKELQSQLDAVVAREKDAQTKLKELQEKEAELASKDSQQQKDWSAKQKELQDREASLAKSEEEQQSKHAAKTKELQEREAALAMRAESLNSGNESAKEQLRKLKDQLKDLKARENALVQKEEDAAASGKCKLDQLQRRETALAKKEKESTSTAEAKLKDLQKREREIEEREKQVKARESEVTKSTAASTVGGARANSSKPRDGASSNGAKKDSPQDEQMKELQKRLSKLEDQLGTSKPSANTKPQSNGTPGKGKPNAAPAPVSCGHEIHRPPRKLERKVVGYVYKS